MKLEAIGRLELASRVVLDEPTGSWFVLGIDDPTDAALVAEEIESLTGEPVPVLEVTRADELIEASRTTSSFAVLVSVDDIESLQLDESRSMLKRTHPAVLALPTSTLARIASAAPHFTSWIGGRIFRIEEDHYLGDVAREQRLAMLREHYGMTDDGFIELVERGDSELEPEHIEWLVLLSRQDLLEALR